MWLFWSVYTWGTSDYSLIQTTCHQYLHPTTVKSHSWHSNSLPTPSLSEVAAAVPLVPAPCWAWPGTPTLREQIPSHARSPAAKAKQTSFKSHEIWGVETAQWLDSECWTHDRKVQGLSPCRSGRRILFSSQLSVLFLSTVCADSYFGRSNHKKVQTNAKTMKNESKRLILFCLKNVFWFFIIVFDRLSVV